MMTVGYKPSATVWKQQGAERGRRSRDALVLCKQCLSSAEDRLGVEIFALLYELYLAEQVQTADMLVWISDNTAPWYSPIRKAIVHFTPSHWAGFTEKTADESATWFSSKFKQKTGKSTFCYKLKAKQIFNVVQYTGITEYR